MHKIVVHIRRLLFMTSLTSQVIQVDKSEQLLRKREKQHIFHHNFDLTLLSPLGNISPLLSSVFLGGAKYNKNCNIA